MEHFKYRQLNNKIVSIGNDAEKEEHKEKVYTFLSHNLTMYSVEVSRKVLSSNDESQ